MTQDSDLFGATPPPKPTDRLFFALFPSEEAIPKSSKRPNICAMCMV